ncbi:ribokinase [Rhodoferax sp. AJA081-3]|uniref:ribokinase n=1 Tax=Rhodoferax sp. AJA081-3 TaxID=2752316 RepID=UPI001ADEDA6C|nr:ribokinase [Rhodoferax sp. AJA081-3]QTN28760.1 ribokinase [Rhodoferax sp. AJA081-3]
MILVAGSSNLDFVVRAHHIPAPGETVLGRDFKTFPGGKGANQAVACARAGGAPTTLLTAMGADAFATPIENSLREAAVALNIVRINDQPTGTAFICVSEDAENAITVAPGANLCLLEQHLPSLQDVSHLLMQLEIPLTTVIAYAKAARQQGVTTVLNAAPIQQLPAELLEWIDVLVVNEGELASLSGHSGSIAECLERIAVPTVVVTLGHRGSCARTQGTFLVQPACAITPVDTTAAGDTFCGSLVAALSTGTNMPQALSLAGAAGALACTRLGAQSSIPHQAEVAAFLAQQPAKTAAAMDALGAYCGLPAGTYS